MATVYANDIDGYLSQMVSAYSKSDPLLEVPDIKCQAKVFMKQAFIEFADESLMHRPYLHLIGEVRELYGDFLQNVDHLVLPVGSKAMKAHYRYEFSDQELSDLALKGLFNPGFDVPDIFKQNEFELPLHCRMKAASQMTGDVPIIFVGINNWHDIQTNEAESEYTLAQYFEPLKKIEDENLITYDTDFLKDDDSYIAAIEPEYQDAEAIYAEQEEQLTEEDELLQAMAEKIDVAVRKQREESIQQRAARVRGDEELEGLMQQPVSPGINLPQAEEGSVFEDQHEDASVMTVPEEVEIPVIEEPQGANTDADTDNELDGLFLGDDDDTITADEDTEVRYEADQSEALIEEYGLTTEEKLKRRSERQLANVPSDHATLLNNIVNDEYGS